MAPGASASMVLPSMGSNQNMFMTGYSASSVNQAPQRNPIKLQLKP